MAIKFKHKLTLLITLLLFSCGKSDQQIKNATLKEKDEQLKTTNEKAIKKLSQRHNSVMRWDTLEQYTYQYQEMFIEQKKAISFEGKLTDITKKDSTYYLHVWSRFYYFKDYIALIEINRQKLIEFQKILNSNNHTNEGCFIFNVSKIVTASPEIMTDLELNGEDSYSYLEYDFNKTLLIFKGKLIDFYLNEIVDKNNAQD